MTPVTLSKDGVSGQALHTVDQYPVEGLGIYEDVESSSHFSKHVWSDCTTKTVQTMHVDEALQAMIDKPARSSTGATMASSQPSVQHNVMTNAEDKASGVATPITLPSPPVPSSGVSMASAERGPESLLTPLPNLKVSL